MNTKQDIRNELFKRQELIVELEGDKNPGFDEARKLIAEQLKKPEENIDVYEIQGKFGKHVFEIGAYAYDSKEELEKMKNLRKTKKQRKADAEAKAESEKPVDKKEETVNTSPEQATEDKAEDDGKEEIKKEETGNTSQDKESEDKAGQDKKEEKTSE